MTNHSLESFKAGSNLVKKTVAFCNGPYFQYQINNLVVLPFSLTLLIIFSFYNKRQTFCIMGKKNPLSCGGANRPGLPDAINPFQRRNRLLVAALFCIIANEIFKIIETSMFNVTVYDDGGMSNRTDLLFSNADQSNTDFLRIGLGIEPRFNKKAKEDIMNTITGLIKPSQTINSTRPSFILQPSVMRYSKPKLPPRLNLNDFTTTSKMPGKSKFALTLSLTCYVTRGI